MCSRVSSLSWALTDDLIQSERVQTIEINVVFSKETCGSTRMHFIMCKDCVLIKARVARLKNVVDMLTKCI